MAPLPIGSLTPPLASAFRRVAALEPLPLAATDIKRCWELSRWAWAPLLARAWRLSGASRFCDGLNAWSRQLVPGQPCEWWQQLALRPGSFNAPYPCPAGLAARRCPGSSQSAPERAAFAVLICSVLLLLSAMPKRKTTTIGHPKQLPCSLAAVGWPPRTPMQQTPSLGR